MRLPRDLSGEEIVRLLSRSYVYQRVTVRNHRTVFRLRELLEEL